MVRAEGNREEEAEQDRLGQGGQTEANEMHTEAQSCTESEAIEVRQIEVMRGVP